MSWESESIKRDVDRLDKQIEKLKSDLLIARQKYGVFKSYQNYDNFTKYNPNDTVEVLQKILDQKEKILEIEKENNKIYKENCDIIESVIKDLIAVGLPEKVSSYKRNKLIYETSKWIIELRSQVPFHNKHYYDWYLIERNIQDKKVKIAQQEELEKRQSENLLVIEKLKLIATKILSSEEIIKVDWSDSDSVKEELIDKLCELDPYLNLAHAMISVRNDWNDGCGLVYAALFEDLPIQIYEEIMECCSDFEDGRVFRDCEYNYNVIFDMADEKYRKLYNEIYQ